MLKQMEYFIAVVDTMSFTKAAEQCYISQSAISQQIHALEETLGVRLLNRKKRSFSITPAGDYFYHRAKDILAQVEEICKETKEIEEDEATLRIGYLRGYSGKEVREAIIEFSSLYPDIRVSLIRGNHEELYNDIKSGKASLVISDQRRVFHEDYVNFHLLHVDCYVDVSVQHPLANQTTIDVEDLTSTSCILVASQEQQEIEQEFYENILGIKSKFIFVNDMEEAEVLVSINRGILPMEKIHKRNDKQDNIVTKPLYKNGKQLQRNYCAFWQKKYTNYYIEEFVDILRKKMRLQSE